MTRVAYKSNVSFKIEGSDPYKLIIKPFPCEMEDMANYIYRFISTNKDELELNNVDLSNEFNSCTILLYHAIPGIKKESSMGWHCDNKFSLKGNFSQQRNGQLYNTPAVIFTIGMDRVLKWRRRVTIIKHNGYKSWQTDGNVCEHMLLKQGHICVINPCDEEPHYDANIKEEVHFQHGNVKVTGNNTSIAFVFRVSPHICNCNIKNNTVILPDSIRKDIEKKEETAKVKQSHRIELYKLFDKNTYHTLIKERFKAILKH